MREDFTQLRGASAAIIAAMLLYAPAVHAQNAGSPDNDSEQAQPEMSPEGDAAEAATAGASSAEAVPAPTAGAEVYEPDYFTQYAPRNALDMLRQIPGFSIRGGGDGGRGLGQADENILSNGERLTSKSDSARDQISRIPAGDVVRIEIVDGTTLDIPGLTGQVANVISRSTGLSGQFEYRAGFRPYNTKPQLFGGEASISGSSGELDYTLAISNENNRFGSDGPNIITDGNGDVIQREFGQFEGRFDNPALNVNLGYDFGSEVTANFNGSLEYRRFIRNEFEDQIPVGGDEFLRSILTDNNAFEYEISGDLQFPLGPGDLKLIALLNDADINFDNSVTDEFVGDLTDTGSQFLQDTQRSEKIARFEYGWNMWSADWQLSGEAAYNTLDRVSGLFELAPDGEFTAIDFPEGTGGVSEDRYETILSFSRQLTGKLAMQATGGVEFSSIEQTGFAANNREFRRPKGSLSFAWKPEQGFDISLEARRTVGQLSFGDVLAQVFLDDGNENSGNNELVPEQSWDLTLEVNKTLGPWGSTTLTVERRAIEDYIDVIPLAGGGESRGNIDSATETELEWESTILLGQAGITGAEIDLSVEYEWTSVLDPVAGFNREFSGGQSLELRANYRHDIPSSQWAYGGGVFYDERRPVFRLSETSLGNEGPLFASLFIEHKDVLGLTVRARASNLLSARDSFERTVFDGVRGTDPVLFTENRDRRVGPTFRLNVSGNF